MLGVAHFRTYFIINRKELCEISQLGMTIVVCLEHGIFFVNRNVFRHISVNICIIILVKIYLERIMSNMMKSYLVTSRMFFKSLIKYERGHFKVKIIFSLKFLYTLVH